MAITLYGLELLINCGYVIFDVGYFYVVYYQVGQTRKALFLNWTANIYEAIYPEFLSFFSNSVTVAAF